MAAAISTDFPGFSRSKPAWLSAAGNMDSEVSTGTTLVAMEFNEGVVVAADTRKSAGTFVSNRVSDKLTPLTDYVIACRSGSAADTQALTDVVKYQMDLHKMELGKQVPVYNAAFAFKKQCYKYRDNFLAGIIVAGWDELKGGQVYSIPIGGMMVRQPVTCGGSGSTYLYGFLDANYREGMTKEECMDLALKCVTLAIHRDGSSGGCCRLAAVTKDGVEKRMILYDELPKHPF